MPLHVDYFHYTPLHVECFNKLLTTQYYTPIMCNNSAIKITHCFWWDLHFSVTLLQWPVPATDARPFLDVSKGETELHHTCCCILQEIQCWNGIFMNKYASPCLFWARAEFLEVLNHHNQLLYYTSLHIITLYSFSLHHIITRFNPLLHVYYTPLHALLHTDSCFITRE